MEWVVLYGLLSTGLNFWQSNTIGELTSDRNNYRNIAEHCTKDGEQERRSASLEASRREIRKTKDESAYQQYRHRSNEVLQSDSRKCLDIVAGDLADGLVDAQRWYIKELSTNRVQPRSNLFYREGNPLSSTNKE